MGLCKCSKRKVTNQFCFEHRVNVCEDCMVNNHAKCIVQSYVQWLQDSDYSPICELCRNGLEVDECVRLICYHVFHWPCLDQYARQLPPNTAPAGYVCPTCREGIFPKSNLMSPIVDKLKSTLSQVNWARVGLGLSLIDETPPTLPRSAPDGSNEDSQSFEMGLNKSSPTRQKTDPASFTATWQQSESSSFSETAAAHSIVNVTGSSSQSYASQYPSSMVSGLFLPSRMYDARDVDSVVDTFDHDENKYDRRSAIQWFSRWFKSVSNKKPPQGIIDPHRKLKRHLMMFLLLLIGLFTLVMIMWRIGRATADADPFLDPNANPNIRVIENIDS